MADDRVSIDATKHNVQINALAAYARPTFDLIGPTVEDDIRRAVWRYGADAVKLAVREATKPKLGRKQKRDWPELRDIIECDARDWLAGNDPFAARSNYAIAKEFAEKNPGHSVISTHKRIERKLGKAPFDREWFTLTSAEELSRTAFPHAAHIRALEALTRLPKGAGEAVWQMRLARARATLADYQARKGVPPCPEMTFQQVEDEAHCQKPEADDMRPEQSAFGAILTKAAAAIS